jgi:hypothetical protein
MKRGSTGKQVTISSAGGEECRAFEDLGNLPGRMQLPVERFLN